MTTPQPPVSTKSANDGPYDERDDRITVAKALTILQKGQNDPEMTELVTGISPRDSIHGKLERREPSYSDFFLMDLCTTALPSPCQLVPTQGKDQKTARRWDKIPQDGCYLIYDNDSGGRLVAHYSHTANPQDNVIGFWTIPRRGNPLKRLGLVGQGSKKDDIQAFKYSTERGYVELIRGIIGGEKNHKKYLQGWCSFVQLAKKHNGILTKFPASKTKHNMGIEVDIYGYEKGKVFPLDTDDGHKLVDVSSLEAVAVVPHNNDRFIGVHALTAMAFLEYGNLEGASLRLH